MELTSKHGIWGIALFVIIGMVSWLGMSLMSVYVVPSRHSVHPSMRIRRDELMDRFPSFVRAAAFNIQILGKTKLSNETLAKEIVRIIRRYDILFIQEIRDSSNETVDRLLDAVNDMRQAESGTIDEQSNGRGSEDIYDYAAVTSEPLGRTYSKERYAYFYRRRRIQLLDSYLYDDSRMDCFERPPFIAHFARRRLSPRGDHVIPAPTLPSDLVFIGVHTSPRNATREINALPLVFEHARNRLNTTNAVILGDLNADCGYVKEKHWDDAATSEAHLGKGTANASKTPRDTDELVMVHDPNYIWLIPTGMDTTVTSRRACTYDRILVRRETFPMVIRGSARAFYYPLYEAPYRQLDDMNDFFQRYYPGKLSQRAGLRGSGRHTKKKKPVPWLADSNMTSHLKLPLDLVERVSDHFPVEFVFSWS